MKIIVTEDSAVYRHLLCTQLADWSYSVEAVPDAESALSLVVAAAEPVLLLIDWELPGMSGLDLVSKIRGLQRKHYIYAVLLTARADKTDIAAALNAGADDYLVKPFHEQEFRARIQVAMRTLALHEKLVVANEQLETLALQDPLTDLMNRRALRRAFDRERLRAQRNRSDTTLMLCDIDLFKQVNDTHGHATGDAVIKLVADVLNAAARGSDLIARLGGDEFLLVLPETAVPGAVILAERVKQLLDGRGELREVAISLSIGIATMSREDTLQQAVERADAALYAAKRAGRNRYCVAGSVE
jgi:diguanylate cyclase (GGDEF)-like protein